MVFSSPIFVFLFLPLVAGLYFLAPRALRNALLLIASLIFYAWGEQLFVFVLLASIGVNWLFGLSLERWRGPLAARLAMLGAIVVNLGLLGFYKYSGFFVAQFNALTAIGGVPALEFSAPHLPLGISFFTFHALSYVIDIYRRDAQAQKNPVDFALYLAFFPQLVAGPIVRYHDISDQLRKRRENFDFAVSGAERALAGFGKKILLANPLGEVADRIFALPPDQLGAGAAWLGLIAYVLQIYLDFSAYSDMAIGLARIFGFNFLENFNYPFRSRSVHEFWRRWHISLSNWFRDYLYIPLGGNRVGATRGWLNLILVFLICGLWHGAAWTFILWGALHGFWLCVERAGFAKILARWPAPLSWTFTTLALVPTWVAFRSETIPAGLHYMAALLGFGATADQAASALEWLDLQTVVTLICAAAASVGLFTRVTSDWRLRANQKGGVVEPKLESLRIGADGAPILALRLAVLVAAAVFGCARMATGAYNPFIYFRF